MQTSRNSVNLRDIITILSKEIRYALRDPDVIIYGVIFPLVFYPMVMIGRLPRPQHTINAVM